MIIYRYEKDDGGGPFMTKDGKNRYVSNCQMDDEYKYGCISLQALNEYFLYQQNAIIDCQLKIYNIPDNEVIIEERQVKFPKYYSFIN